MAMSSPRVVVLELWIASELPGPRRHGVVVACGHLIEEARVLCSAVRGMLLLGAVPWLAAMSSHLVTKLHHAALVGFDLRQMEGDVSVKLLEEWDPVTNQDRQDRIANFVG